MIFRPKYFFGETFSNLKRNFLMFFTAITTVAITLFIVGFFLILVYDIQGILGSIKSQVEVAVYLKDNITDELRVYLENEIKSWDEISEVKYISKEQALENFKGEYEGSDILKEIQGNPLPASFELRLESPEKVDLVALRFIDKDGNYIEGVDDVIYGQSYVQKLFSIVAIVGTIAFLIIAVLLLATVVLIFNTIRLSIHARKKEIEVIYNFIDFSKYPSIGDDECERGALANENERIIVHVSNFRPVKRIKDVISVFDKIQKVMPAKLLMVGDGPEREHADLQVKQLGIRDKVLFLGNSNEVNKILCYADLFLLPSETESFGLAALEAMAAKTPVISSNSGGLSEVNVHSVTGFTSNVGDIDDMAKNAIYILEDDIRLQEFKMKAQEFAQQFSIDNVLPLYEEVYRTVKVGCC